MALSSTSNYWVGAPEQPKHGGNKAKRLEAGSLRSESSLHIFAQCGVFQDKWVASVLFLWHTIAIIAFRFKL